MGISRHQIPQRQDAGEPALVVGDVQGINGLGVAGAPTDDVEGLKGGLVLLQGDVFGRHQTTGGFRFVAEQLSGDLAFLRAELVQQLTHHLGRQFFKQPRPIVRRHLFHHLLHLAGAQQAQQVLLGDGVEVLVNTDGLVLAEQTKGNGLQVLGKIADRLSHIHRLHRLQQQLHRVVITNAEHGLELPRHHLRQQVVFHGDARCGLPGSLCHRSPAGAQVYGRYSRLTSPQRPLFSHGDQRQHRDRHHPRRQQQIPW